MHTFFWYWMMIMTISVKILFASHKPHEHVRVVLERVVCVINICSFVGTLLLLQYVYKTK